MKQQEIDLIEANKKAETAMNARSQFLANMSHELRTPIAGMLGLLELLKTKDQLERGTVLSRQHSCIKQQSAITGK